MEINVRHGEQNSTMRLYEASLRGCVSTLNELVQNDPLILDRLSLTSLSETPLHIASLGGHIDFAKALLSLKPKLVAELDSCRRSPLHLASAEGHAKIVKALLGSTDDRHRYDACLERDEDGRIALHLAAMRGRVDAMAELVKANPNSVKVLLNGESVWHLCVRYNHLEALKFLVNKLGNEHELLNLMDMDGNTILHLAVKLHQIETVKYLVSLPGVRAKANVYDVLEKSPRPKDLKSFQIQEILMNDARDGKRSFNPPPRKGGVAPQMADLRPAWCSWMSARSYMKIRQYLNCRTDWVDLAHGNFMVVATVIATMSFAAATNPPGGVWQEDTTTGAACKGTCKAGTAVLAYGDSKKSYKFFFISNTISYIASLSVILLHFAGFGLKKRVGMWLLIVTMCTMLTFMLLTYLEASWLVTPDDLQSHVENTYTIVSAAWLMLLACVCLNHSIRFFYWLCFGKVPKWGRSIRNCWVNGKGLENHEVGA